MRWFFFCLITHSDQNCIKWVEFESSSRICSACYLAGKWSLITRCHCDLDYLTRDEEAREEKLEKKDATVLNKHFYDFPLFSFWKIANVAFLPRRYLVFIKLLSLRELFFSFLRGRSCSRYTYQWLSRRKEDVKKNRSEVYEFFWILDKTRHLRIIIFFSSKSFLFVHCSSFWMNSRTSSSSHCFFFFHFLTIKAIIEY